MLWVLFMFCLWPLLILTSDLHFEGVSEDIATVTATLMQKHNVAQSSYEKEKKDEKEVLIRKKLGRLEKQVEEVVLDN